MSFDKFPDDDVVVLRSTTADIEQKVFRYETDGLLTKKGGMDASSIGCVDESLVSVRNDSDSYCDWIEMLTGD
jgi:hypothetical protein